MDDANAVSLLHEYRIGHKIAAFVVVATNALGVDIPLVVPKLVSTELFVPFRVVLEVAGVVGQSPAGDTFLVPLTGVFRERLPRFGFECGD